MEQIPYQEKSSFIDHIEIVSNPEDRCPVVLLFDVSYSMNGQPIELLNDALRLFASDIASDPLASKRVEVALVTFSDSAHIHSDFAAINDFVPPRLTAGGSTAMASGVLEAMDLIERRKTIYREHGIRFYRPWIFLLTDGEPTDKETPFWRQAVDGVHAGEAAKRFLFWGISVGIDALPDLRELCPPLRPPLPLKGLNFRELFKWLSSSLKGASSGKPGDTLKLMPPTGWVSVEI